MSNHLYRNRFLIVPFPSQSSTETLYRRGRRPRKALVQAISQTYLSSKTRAVTQFPNVRLRLTQMFAPHLCKRRYRRLRVRSQVAWSLPIVLKGFLNDYQRLLERRS